MSKKYLHLVAFYAVLIVTTYPGCNAKEHDVADGDDRNALGDLFKDTVSNMRLLLRPKVATNEIYLRENSKAKFRNMAFTRLPDDVHRLSLMGVKCSVNDPSYEYFKIEAPLGHYQVNGSIETPDDDHRYTFAITMNNVLASFVVRWNTQNISEQILTSTTTDSVLMLDGIVQNKFKYDSREISRILYNQTEMIASQISAAYDLPSHFLPAKNRCYNSHYHANVKQPHEYLINRTYTINQTDPKPLYRYNFTIEWIKIKNFHFDFDFYFLNETTEEISFIFKTADQTDMSITFSGYYHNDKGNRNVSSEYNVQLSSLSIEVTSTSANRDISQRFVYLEIADREYDVQTNLWLLWYGPKLQQIIKEDILSVLRRKNAEI